MNDYDLVRHFEACTLPFEQWTHRAHVRVAFLYLRENSFEAALDRIRVGIQRYNAANAVPETPTSGYNETTTHASLHLIAATIGAYGDVLPTHDSETFCDTHPQLMTRNVLRLFYSPRQRMHPLAKTRFIEPDLTSLPTIMPGKERASAK